jgi:MOSC domain-containing protein YiiM
MKLLSVNVSLPQEMAYRGQKVMTGIYKMPVSGRVMVRTLNVDGDQQADLKVHGGPDQAVYIYAHEHYAYWSRELSRNDFSFGQFGENFTTEGLLEAEVRVGDVFRVGGALVQVTRPRVPCFKLMTKMNNFRLAKPFLASGRTGFYLRVLEEGEVGAGDPIQRIKTDPSQLTIQGIVQRDYLDDDFTSSR